MMRIIASSSHSKFMHNRLSNDNHSTASQPCNWRSIFFHFSYLRKPRRSSWRIRRHTTDGKVRTSVLHRTCKKARRSKDPKQTLVVKPSTISVWYMDRPMRPSRESRTYIWIIGSVVRVEVMILMVKATKPEKNIIYAIWLFSKHQTQFNHSVETSSLEYSAPVLGCGRQSISSFTARGTPSNTDSIFPVNEPR